MLKQISRGAAALIRDCSLWLTALWSQAIFATLTGVVTDSSGAVVANASVTLRNAESGDIRTIGNE